jgi:hypothetical protein
MGKISISNTLLIPENANKIAQEKCTNSHIFKSGCQIKKCIGLLSVRL